MQTRWWLVGFALASVPALAWAQSATKQERPRGRLTRVAPPRASQETAEEFDRDAWKKKITASDLKEREEAFDRLAGIARRDSEAREALEDWSEDSGELAWTSRLILREVERAPHAWVYGGAQPGWDLFGRDFDFDDFAQRFEDLDSLFGDLRSEWGQMLESLPHPSSGNLLQLDGSQSMTLQSGPEGVTCKITEEVDGQETTREYTAKSMEELLEAHPELRSKVGGHGMRIWTLPQQGFRGQLFSPRAVPFDGGVHVRPRERRTPDVAGKPGEPRTDRLGIYWEPLDEDMASDLGLDAGQGLHVQSTEPGSIASVLGVREGDVVVEINGTAIRSADDVKRVLADRAEGAEVSVVVASSEGRRTLTWKPAAQRADKKSESKESDSGARKL